MNDNNQNNTTENTEKGTPCFTTKSTKPGTLRSFLFISWVLIGIAVVLHNLIGQEEQKMSKSAHVTKREINRYNEHIVVEFPTKQLMAGTLCSTGICALAGVISYIALGLFV